MTKLTCARFLAKLTWQTSSDLHLGKQKLPRLLCTEWLKHCGLRCCHHTSTVWTRFHQQRTNHPQPSSGKQAALKELPRANQLACQDTRWQQQHLKKQINKERKESKIKINTNRKGEQSEVVGGEGIVGLRMLAGCFSLVKSKWECIIWALHRIDPEHPPLHWAFLPAQIEGLPQEEVLWLGTIGIYPLLICGTGEANPWKKKADTESEGRWMMPGWRGVEER